MPELIVFVFHSFKGLSIHHHPFPRDDFPAWPRNHTIGIRQIIFERLGEAILLKSVKVSPLMALSHEYGSLQVEDPGTDLQNALLIDVLVQDRRE